MPKMDLNNIPEALTLPLRLSILASLLDGEKTFKEIQYITNGTDGNISVQLKKLQNWGYLSSRKKLTPRKMQNFYIITNFGLNQLNAYVDLLENILKQHVNQI